MRAQVRFVCAAAIAALGAGVTLIAQSGGQPAQPASPGHVHYVKPPEQAAAPGAPVAPRLQKLGSHTFPTSTKHKQAQLFINQGVNLAYAFNHAESHRAFREAARLDPTLAIAYWGEALVLGPNINA